MPPKRALKASLQSRKQELVRDAIWAAAIDLFAEKGFEETTIDDIVEAVGTSRRTFFRYFESKRDLMAQPVLSFGESLTAAIVACPATFSLAELFRHVVLDVAARSVLDSRLRKLMEIAAKYPAAREAQVSRVAVVQDQLAAAYKKRCKDEGVAHVLAGLTLSALSSVHRLWFTKGSKDISAAVRQVLSDFSLVVCGERVK